MAVTVPGNNAAELPRVYTSDHQSNDNVQQGICIVKAFGLYTTCDLLFGLKNDLHVSERF